MATVTPRFAYDARVTLSAVDALRAVRAASVAEVAWQDRQRVRVRGVVPLVGAEGPVLALPWAEEPLARSLAAAGEVLLTVTDPRATGAAYAPVRLRCRPRLVEDRTGERFDAELLDQELLRYPPSRLLADSVLLRREHWWWLPRLLVGLDVLDARPARSRGAGEHLLVVATATGLEAAVARVRTTPGTTPGTAPTVDVVAGTPGAGPAALFGQDVSFPDFERWGQWAWHGSWDGAHLLVDEAPERVGLPPVPGVLARWRRQRTLERGCRRALGA